MGDKMYRDDSGIGANRVQVSKGNGFGTTCQSLIKDRF